MKILVAVAMLAVLIATGLEAISLVFGAFEGDYTAIWATLIVSLESQVSQASIAWLSAGVAVITWTCVLLAFWPLHRIIWAESLSFRFVGTMLKRSAFACFGFWLGSTVMFFVIPYFLVWFWSATSLDGEAILPLGFETMFLILSLIFMTIGQTLQRAEEIEDEINHIL